MCMIDDNDVDVVTKCVHVDQQVSKGWGVVFLQFWTLHRVKKYPLGGGVKSALFCTHIAILHLFYESKNH